MHESSCCSTKELAPSSHPHCMPHPRLLRGEPHPPSFSTTWGSPVGLQSLLAWPEHQLDPRSHKATVVDSLNVSVSQGLSPEEVKTGESLKIATCVSDHGRTHTVREQGLRAAPLCHQEAGPELLGGYSEGSCLRSGAASAGQLWEGAGACGGVLAGRRMARGERQVGSNIEPSREMKGPKWAAPLVTLPDNFHSR